MEARGGPMKMAASVQDFLLDARMGYIHPKPETLNPKP